MRGIIVSMATEGQIGKTSSHTLTCFKQHRKVAFEAFQVVILQKIHRLINTFLLTYVGLYDSSIARFNTALKYWPIWICFWESSTMDNTREFDYGDWKRPAENLTKNMNKQLNLLKTVSDLERTWIDLRHLWRTAKCQGGMVTNIVGKLECPSGMLSNGVTFFSNQAPFIWRYFCHAQTVKLTR